jgi:hypothetical protein
MRKKHVLVHRNTGEPNKNGHVYAKGCNIILPKKSFDIKHMRRNITIGKVENISIENDSMYADIKLTVPFVYLFGRYVGPTFEVLEPKYDPTRAITEQMSLPATKVELIEFKLIEKPADPGIDRIKK